jgi:protein CMS1
VVSLRRMIVDASHIDQKKRGVMDMKETAIPLAQWLGRKEFKERYNASEKPLDLLFY